MCGALIFHARKEGILTLALHQPPVYGTAVSGFGAIEFKMRIDGISGLLTSRSFFLPTDTAARLTVNSKLQTGRASGASVFGNPRLAFPIPQWPYNNLELASLLPPIPDSGTVSCLARTEGERKSGGSWNSKSCMGRQSK